MSYCFSDLEVQKITARFGAEFFDQLKLKLPYYLKKWQISEVTLIDYFSVNCVFKGVSAEYGKVIMKIGKPSKETYTEYHALADYRGRGFCRAYQADLNEGVILLACIEPGIRLRDESDLKKRLKAFSGVYTGLHTEPENSDVYPSYLDWVSRISTYMKHREDFIELSDFMTRAEGICLELGKKYTSKMLLHGDLHHDNLLLSEGGQYLIIDPKGVIGDPIWDLPRFILNEYEPSWLYENRLSHIQTIICWLSDHLNIPYRVLCECFFVESTMAVCWDVEDGGKPDFECVRMAAFLCE